MSRMPLQLNTFIVQLFIVRDDNWMVTVHIVSKLRLKHSKSI